MTFDEFIAFRDVKIKNAGHERIVRLFFPYLEFVSGNARLSPDLLGNIIGLDTSTTVPMACFNGTFDEGSSPYPDVDFYVRLDNGIQICVYQSFKMLCQKRAECGRIRRFSHKGLPFWNHD